MRTHARAVWFGSALAFSLSAAYAQDTETSGPAFGAPPENVIVVAPVPHARSEIGAPIVDVQVSRNVRFDDLDLRTDGGAQTLEGRIRFAAKTLCNRLNAMYPVDAVDIYGGMWPTASTCYRDTIHSAMLRADDAIRAARGGSYAGYGGGP